MDLVEKEYQEDLEDKRPDIIEEDCCGVQENLDDEKIRQKTGGV